MRSLISLHENRAYGPRNFDTFFKTTFATQSTELRASLVVRIVPTGDSAPQQLDHLLGAASSYGGERYRA